MIVSCHGCGTRFHHRMPPGAAPDCEATGRCSVCHGSVPLVPAKKPYVLVQADLRRVAIGYDDPGLAQEVHRTGRGPIDESALRAFRSKAPVPGDLAGPSPDPLGLGSAPADADAFDAPEADRPFEAGAAADAAAGEADADPRQAGPGAVARLGTVLLPALGLAAAGYHGAPYVEPFLADLPLGAAGAWAGSVWVPTALGGLIGLGVGWILLRWKSAKP